MEMTFEKWGVKSSTLRSCKAFWVLVAYLYVSSTSFLRPCPHVSGFKANPQFFLCGFKNFYVHTSTRIRIQSEFARARVRIRSSIQDSSVAIVNRAFAFGRATGESISFSRHVEYLRGKGWIWVCYLIGSESIRIWSSTRFQIHCGFKLSTLEGGFKKWRIRRIPVDVWILCESAKKKLSG